MNYVLINIGIVFFMIWCLFVIILGTLLVFSCISKRIDKENRKKDSTSFKPKNCGVKVNPTNKPYPGPPKKQPKR